MLGHVELEDVTRARHDGEVDGLSVAGLLDLTDNHAPSFDVEHVILLELPSRNDHGNSFQEGLTGVIITLVMDARKKQKGLRRGQTVSLLEGT